MLAQTRYSGLHAAASSPIPSLTHTLAFPPPMMPDFSSKMRYYRLHSITRSPAVIVMLDISSKLRYYRLHNYHSLAAVSGMTDISSKTALLSPALNADQAMQ
ncbi:hypothetical protein [Cohnella hashimotonis]|uniref:Uncharacterized protein n=1 Tax=Cohnella hashimotonis TaxID=2826895 RepID=A0ABT6TG62_9BACL|nr:hypothetical protein [Cohnella hashimotonis]MDI4645295.1 hypothetical protein [Cohnella hashimotonis]